MNTVPDLRLSRPRSASKAGFHLQDVCTWFLRPSVLIRVVLYLTALIYLRTILFDYVFDDGILIITNPWMASWRCVPAIFTHSFWGFLDTPRQLDFYRPLVMLLLAAIFHVFGAAPGWFHLIAASLHVLATYLVYLLACETTEDRMIAAVAAGIFGLHPTKVETAAWISGISDSLSLVFFLSSMICYFKWRRNGKDAPILVFSSAIFLLLALFSKEIALFAPVLVAIIEFGETQGSLRDRCVATIRAAWSFAIVSAFALSIRILFVHNPIGSTATPIPPITTLLTAPRAIAWYLEKQIWPVQLSIEYPLMIVKHFSVHDVLFPLLLVVTLFAAVVLRVRKSTIGLFFLCWFCFTLFPIILYCVMLQEHDRYFYFASVPTSIGLSYFVVELRHFSKIFQAAAVSLILIAMATITIHYESYWESDFTLFERAAHIAPDNPDAYEYLASEYIATHQFARAEAIANTLINNPERRTEGWYLLGNVRMTENDYDGAREAMENAVQTAPNQDVRWRFPLADVDLRFGRNEKEAAEIYRKGIEEYPASPFLHGRLATALDQIGQSEEAKRERRLQSMLTN